MTVKVFHVVESFDGQAIERWLTSVVRMSVVQGTHEWTFFCILPHEGRYESEMRLLGARVVHATAPVSDTLAFMASMRRSMAESRADVLHCHHDLMSGAYLLASVGLPFAKRIVHVHNTEPSLPTPNRAKTAVAGPVLRRLCLRMANHIVGVSGDALEALTKGNNSRGRQDTIIPGGVDTQLFRERTVERRLEIRRGLGLGPDELVLAFVGRLVESKNPGFCLEVLKRMKFQGALASLLIVGEGSLQSALAEEARSLALADRVKLLGRRDDVADVMLASDLLLWTAHESPKEGLGLAVVEAQAAGLPVLASRSLPDEAIVVPELVQFLALGEGPDEWARAAKRATVAARPSRAECLARVESSPCSLHSSAAALFQLYDEATRI